MDIERIAQFIAETTALPGVPGYEAGVNGGIADWFRPYARDVFTDDLENLYALVGAGRALARRSSSAPTRMRLAWWSAKSRTTAACAFSKMAA